MSKLFIGAGAISGIAPLLMGATGVALPNGAPDWLPWVLVVAGPALAALGAFGVKAAVNMFRSLAKALRKDKDDKNDVFADVLDAAADGLEAAKKEKK